MEITIVILLLFVIFIAAKSIKIVRQSEVYVIERLGKYLRNANAGLQILVPFIDSIRARISLRQQTMDIPPQGVITKDNVTLTIDTVVFYQITDPFKAVYEIESLQRAISYLALTTMRDIIGKMDLDNTFSSRDLINTQLRDVLDEATDKWGCKIDRVEVKDIRPPADIKDAMEKQMNAERNKRALILEAEGQRQSAITRAEGEKEAAILKAEADKQSNIRRAEGVREAKILEATGESEAIKKIAEAKAQEVNMVYSAIKDAKPDEKLVAIKSLEALEKVADGQANKVFIPFDATQTLAAVSTMFEMKK
jgi:regulator of protease activity HflC (stomatin/prohibitin superfamily)